MYAVVCFKINVSPFPAELTESDCPIAQACAAMIREAVVRYHLTQYAAGVVPGVF